MSSHLILIVQIAVTIIILNLLVGNINVIKRTNSLFKPLSFYNCGIIYMPISVNDDFDFLYDIEGVRAVHSIDQYLLTYNGDEIPLLAYDQNIVNLFLPELSEGKWLNNTSTSDDFIPILTLQESKFELGNTYLFQDLNNNLLPVKVIGKLKEPTYILDLNFASNNLRPDHIFQYYDSRYANDVICLTLKESLSRFTTVRTGTHISKIVLFEEDISNDKYTAALEQISKRGDFIRLDRVLENGILQERNILKAYLPYLICTLFMTIIGFFGLTILNVFQNIYTYSIMYLVGIPPRKCAKICFENSLFISICSIFLVFALYFVVYIIDYNYIKTFAIDYNNLLVTFLFYSSLTSISYFFPRVYISKNSLAHLLKTKQ